MILHSYRSTLNSFDSLLNFVSRFIWLALLLFMVVLIVGYSPLFVAPTGFIPLV